MEFITNYFIYFFIFVIFYFSIVTLCIVMSIAFSIHKFLHRHESTTVPGFWDSARDKVAKMWYWYGRILHGHEIVGLENLPEKGPALIIFYHGTVPVDMFYVVHTTWLLKKRLIHLVADKFIFKLPGWASIAEATSVSTGTIDSCVATLKAGNLLGIGPGGVYESQFSQNRYEVLWRNRLGFAKIAIEAKVPVIPMFTENSREGYRVMEAGKTFFEKIYETVKWPVVPAYGNFPVKFRTHLGKPIEYDPKLTPEELRDKVIAAIEELIIQNQRLPGQIWEGILDRFRNKVPVDIQANRKYFKNLKRKIK